MYNLQTMKSDEKMENKILRQHVRPRVLTRRQEVESAPTPTSADQEVESARTHTGADQEVKAIPHFGPIKPSSFSLPVPKI